VQPAPVQKPDGAAFLHHGDRMQLRVELEELEQLVVAARGSDRRRVDQQLAGLGRELRGAPGFGEHRDFPRRKHR